MRRNRALARACSHARRFPAVLTAAATGLVTAAALVAPAATTTAGAATKGTVNFDAVMDLTGTYGQYGAYQLAGDKAIVAVLNEQGGINGKKVVLHYVDDQSNASAAALDAQQLLQQYPSKFMDSGTVTATCNAILPVTTKAKVISFCAGSFIQTKFPYSFSLIPTPTAYGNAEDSALKHLGVKKFATITDTEAGDLVDTKIGKTNAPKYGLQTVAYVTTPVGASDFTAALQQAKNAGAQAVDLSSVVASSVVACMRDVQTLGWTNVKVLVNDESIGTDVMTNIPSAVESQFYAWAPRTYLATNKATTPLSKAFIKQLAAQGPVGAIGISAYHADAVNLAKYAVETAKSTNVTKMVKALEGMKEANISPGHFISYQNPEYSKAVRALPASALTNFWALLRPGTPQTGRYQGTPYTVTSP